MKNRSTGRLSGFTLIELLVVVLIIGILSAIALPQYQKAVAKARFATVKATARALAEAENAYYMANGEFSSDVQNLDIQLPAGGTLVNKGTIEYSWGRCYIACLHYQCGGCSLKDGLTYFFPDFTNRRPECVVSDSAAPYYKEICLAETGKKENQGIHENSYTRYAY